MFQPAGSDVTERQTPAVAGVSCGSASISCMSCPGCRKDRIPPAPEGPEWVFQAFAAP
jgi:hypothetical protein